MNTEVTVNVSNNSKVSISIHIGLAQSGNNTSAARFAIRLGKK